MAIPEFEDTTKRPSLNSLLAHKDRVREAAQIEKAQEDNYTDTELKIMAEARAMSLQEHLTELRTRLIRSILIVLLCACGAYYYSDEILHILTAPAGKLYYMRPTEAFFTYMKVSMYAGIIVASPVLFYELWAFVKPALTKGEKRVTDLLVPIAIVLFWSGILFSYFFVLPAAIRFFIGFGSEDLQALFSVGQYLSFIVSFIFPFGVVFELPLVIVILAHFGIITSKYLRAQLKYFIFLSFVIGALISPTPDMFSQTMIAAPMLILYVVSYYVVRYIMHK